MSAIRTIKKAAKTFRNIKRYRTLRRDAQTLKTSVGAIFRPQPAYEEKIRGGAKAASRNVSRISPAKNRKPDAAKNAMTTFKAAWRIFGVTVLFRMAKACLRTLR